MVIEFAAFIRGHRKDKRLIGMPLLIRLPFSQIQRGQRGVEVKVKLLFATGLTIGEAGELFRFPENKFDLEARPVSFVELNRIKV